MIQKEMKRVVELVGEVIHVAKQKQSPQLLSITDKIEPTDPYHFFEQAKQIGENRLFWSSTTEGFYLVGAGETFAIKANQRNRYEQTEKQWQQMLANAVIYNPYQSPGTGPIAIGGFSFDPEKEKTTLWNNFDDSQFRVPTYLLTITENTYYLTLNIMVRPEDHAQQIEYMIEKDKQLLFHTTGSTYETPVISNKQEIGATDWKQVVDQATEAIMQNQVSKVVLAREMRVTFEKTVNITAILANLMRTQTRSYIFAIENNSDCFLGATPERLVRVDGEQLLSTCLAGTAPRGNSVAEDNQIGQQLLHDEKNRSEHQFVVEMIRDAIASYCDNIVIPNKPVLYPLKNLQHLYTPVKAKLKKTHTIFDIVKELHPTPALGGFPRQASLTFIRDYEQLDRGWYGAPIGWLDANQSGEFAVAIRSALVKETEASLFAGCGIVKDSDPEEEYQETTMKFTPMLSVLGG
ncbi:isochorismate synthase [Aquibacillus sediminis]|uniref:isochorismate synthase n=1 Tax=Aquibacillus sediminis TaxID=2574734 RepID=UPI001107A6E8|nr:isochorismate synthase [Aquibacillus sediminis]